MTGITYEYIVAVANDLAKKELADFRYVSSKYHNDLLKILLDFHIKKLNELYTNQENLSKNLQKYTFVCERARELAKKDLGNMRYVNPSDNNQNLLDSLFIHRNQLLKLELAPPPKQKPVEEENSQKPSNIFEYVPFEIVVKQDTVIKNIVKQINGCFNYGFYDAAMVMIRRLIENLIILNFLKRNKETEIKREDESGLYLQLGGLIKKLLDAKDMTLSANTRKVITSSKELGDVAAHNPLTNLKEQDLVNEQPKIRVLIEELIYNLDNHSK